MAGRKKTNTEGQINPDGQAQVLDAENQPSESQEGKHARVTFVRQWCAAHRTYIAGQSDELPLQVAKSLVDEGVARLEE